MEERVGGLQADEEGEDGPLTLDLISKERLDGVVEGVPQLVLLVERRPVGQGAVVRLTEVHRLASVHRQRVGERFHRVLHVDLP